MRAAAAGGGLLPLSFLVAFLVPRVSPSTLAANRSHPAVCDVVRAAIREADGDFTPSPNPHRTLP